jgi:hypothetical protein
MNCGFGTVAPNYSYSWKEQEIYESSNLPTGCFRDKNGARHGSAWGPNPAFEIANSLQVFPGNMAHIICRLYPGWLNPAAQIGQEYVFLGGFTGNVARLVQVGCDVNGSPVYFYFTDIIVNGRIVTIC